MWSKFLKTTPIVLAASLLGANSVLANETNPDNPSQDVFTQIELYSDNSAVLEENTGSNMDQVNSVFQLRDVSPSDWAFEALRNLVEKYGCIAGYPDGTYKGQRALTRYEFAAGLNACLQSIERLIVGGGMDTGDLDSIRRLVQEFESELAALGARVDNLEGRVSYLEDHQFSTTTKLAGEAIFSLNDVFGNNKAIDSRQVTVSDKNYDDVATDLDSNPIFADRVRLALNTSFYGKDNLRTRLEAGNFDTNYGKATGTNMARLGYDASTPNNDVILDELYYKAPYGNATLYVGATGLDLDDVLNTHNPFFESSGSGALSRFARRNPLTQRGPEGTGAALSYKFGDMIKVTGLYLASGNYFGNDAADPSPKNGLFNGSYSFGGQIDISPLKNLSFGLTYLNKYQKFGDVNLSGSTGSPAGNDPFNYIGLGSNTASFSDNFGLEANWRIAKWVNFSGWVGYSRAHAASGDSVGQDADLWTWATLLAFPDLGGEGNVLGFIFGQPPKVTGINDSGSSNLGVDPDTSYLLEAQYRYKLSDNILITPGAYVIFNPNHYEENDTIWVGTIRTTFKF